jgi:hypothetical protein
MVERRSLFDSLYFYGGDRPIHISYALQHKRNIWTFTTNGMPTRKGIEDWIEVVKRIDEFLLMDNHRVSTQFDVGVLGK